MSNQNLEVKVNAFLNSVQLLFHSNNNEVKKKANKFLINLEKNEDSCDVAFQVLLKDNLPEEAYFNALQILKNKIKFDFGNYIENPLYIEKLLYFLSSNIDKFKNSKHYLVINYCDCIGKAFLFTGDKFKFFLQQFTNKLSSNNNDINSLICLLLIFNFINEACVDEKMVIDEKSRKNFKKNVQSISGDVFQFITFLINKLDNLQNDKLLKKFITNQILETLINYISIELDENVLIKFNNDYLPIINFIFQINEDNLEKHSECICYLLQLPLHKDNMRDLAKFIFTKILNFKDIFYKSIQSLDYEQSSFYVDVFTSMVQNNLEDILKEKRYDLIQIIVDLTKKCPSIKIGAICEFFESFNEFLYNKNYSVEEVMKYFKNIFIQLIQNLITLTMFEDDIFLKLNQSKPKKLENDEEYTNTMDYRIAIKELLEDFIVNYGFNFIFNEILFPEFKIVVSKIKDDVKNIKLWNKLENILFIFLCISTEIKPDEGLLDNLTVFFLTIFEIPKEYVQITRIITDIIDNCSTIFSKDKNLLLKGFKYLVIGLDNKLTLKYCSMSAKKFLATNKEIMSDLKLDLISLYNEKIKDKIISDDKYLYIAEGLTEVITYTNKNTINNGNNNNDYELIKKTLVEIMKPWVFYLQEAKKLMENNVNFSHDDKDKLNGLLIIFKYISKSAFDGLDENNKNIMYEIFTEIWPLITYILNKNSNNGEIVENIIQLIKIYMRGLKDIFIKFIPEYVQCIVNGYKSIPISSYLYGFEILIAAYPGEQNEPMSSTLNNTFNELSQITLKGYIKNEFDINILVEIGYDFFGMLFRIMKKSPTILLDSKYLEDIIKSAMIYFNTNQIQEIKNIILFFQQIISYDNSDIFKEMQKKNYSLYQKYKNIIQKYINDFSIALCEKILKCFIDVPTEGVIEEVIELFKDFIQYQRPLVIKGMEIHLKNITNDILTNKEKENFINIINNFDLKEKEFDKFMNNFENRCMNKQIRDKGKKKY